MQPNINPVKLDKESQTLYDEQKKVMNQVLAWIDELPISRERSIALTKIEEASMWLSKAIAEAQRSSQNKQ